MGIKILNLEKVLDKHIKEIENLGSSYRDAFIKLIDFQNGNFLIEKKNIENIDPEVSLVPFLFIEELKKDINNSIKSLKKSVKLLIDAGFSDIFEDEIVIDGNYYKIDKENGLVLDIEKTFGIKDQTYSGKIFYAAESSNISYIDEKIKKEGFSEEEGALLKRIAKGFENLQKELRVSSIKDLNNLFMEVGILKKKGRGIEPFYPIKTDNGIKYLKLSEIPYILLKRYSYIKDRKLNLVNDPDFYLFQTIASNLYGDFHNFLKYFAVSKTIAFTKHSNDTIQMHRILYGLSYGSFYFYKDLISKVKKYYKNIETLKSNVERLGIFYEQKVIKDFHNANRFIRDNIPFWNVRYAISINTLISRYIENSKFWENQEIRDFIFDACIKYLREIEKDIENHDASHSLWYALSRASRVYTEYQEELDEVSKKVLNSSNSDAEYNQDWNTDLINGFNYFINSKYPILRKIASINSDEDVSETIAGLFDIVSRNINWDDSFLDVLDKIAILQVDKELEDFVKNFSTNISISDKLQMPDKIRERLLDFIKKYRTRATVLDVKVDSAVIDARNGKLKLNSIAEKLYETEDWFKSIVEKVKNHKYFDFIEIDSDVYKKEDGLVINKKNLGDFLDKSNSLDINTVYKTSLKLRKLLNHRASGLYLLAGRIIAVDFRFGSSFIHELSHHIDLTSIVYNPRRSYIVKELKEYFSPIIKNRADYYLKPTELIARAGEVAYALYLGNYKDHYIDYKSRKIDVDEMINRIKSDFNQSEASGLMESWNYYNSTGEYLPIEKMLREDHPLLKLVYNFMAPYLANNSKIANAYIESNQLGFVDREIEGVKKISLKNSSIVPVLNSFIESKIKEIASSLLNKHLSDIQINSLNNSIRNFDVSLSELKKVYSNTVLRLLKENEIKFPAVDLDELKIKAKEYKNKEYLSVSDFIDYMQQKIRESEEHKTYIIPDLVEKLDTLLESLKDGYIPEEDHPKIYNVFFYLREKLTIEYKRVFMDDDLYNEEFFNYLLNKGIALLKTLKGLRDINPKLMENYDKDIFLEYASAYVKWYFKYPALLSIANTSPEIKEKFKKLFSETVEMIADSLNRYPLKENSMKYLYDIIVLDHHPFIDILTKSLEKRNLSDKKYEVIELAEENFKILVDKLSTTRVNPFINLASSSSTFFRSLLRYNITYVSTSTFSFILIPFIKNKEFFKILTLDKMAFKKTFRVTTHFIGGIKFAKEQGFLSDNEIIEFIGNLISIYKDDILNEINMRKEYFNKIKEAKEIYEKIQRADNESIKRRLFNSFQEQLYSIKENIETPLLDNISGLLTVLMPINVKNDNLYISNIDINEFAKKINLSESQLKSIISYTSRLDDQLKDISFIFDVEIDSPNDLKTLKDFIFGDTDNYIGKNFENVFGAIKKLGEDNAQTYVDFFIPILPLGENSFKNVVEKVKNEFEKIENLSEINDFEVSLFTLYLLDFYYKAYSSKVIERNKINQKQLLNLENVSNLIGEGYVYLKENESHFEDKLIDDFSLEKFYKTLMKSIRENYYHNHKVKSIVEKEMENEINRENEFLDDLEFAINHSELFPYKNTSPKEIKEILKRLIKISLNQDLRNTFEVNTNLLSLYALFPLYQGNIGNFDLFSSIASAIEESMDFVNSRNDNTYVAVIQDLVKGVAFNLDETSRGIFKRIISKVKLNIGYYKEFSIGEFTNINEFSSIEKSRYMYPHSIVLNNFDIVKENASIQDGTEFASNIVDKMGSYYPNPNNLFLVSPSIAKDENYSYSLKFYNPENLDKFIEIVKSVKEVADRNFEYFVDSYPEITSSLKKISGLKKSSKLMRKIVSEDGIYDALKSFYKGNTANEKSHLKIIEITDNIEFNNIRLVESIKKLKMQESPKLKALLYLWKDNFPFHKYGSLKNIAEFKKGKVNILKANEIIKNEIEKFDKFKDFKRNLPNYIYIRDISDIIKEIKEKLENTNNHKKFRKRNVA